MENQRCPNPFGTGGEIPFAVLTGQGDSGSMGGESSLNMINTIELFGNFSF
jgi:hypothetical protein